MYVLQLGQTARLCGIRMTALSWKALFGAARGTQAIFAAVQITLSLISSLERTPPKSMRATRC